MITNVLPPNNALFGGTRVTLLGAVSNDSGNMSVTAGTPINAVGRTPTIPGLIVLANVNSPLLTANHREG